KLQTKRGNCCRSLVARREPPHGKVGVGGTTTEAEVQEARRLSGELQEQQSRLHAERQRAEREAWEQVRVDRIASLETQHNALVERNQRLLTEMMGTSVETHPYTMDRLERRLWNIRLMLGQIEEGMRLAAGQEAARQHHTTGNSVR
ncbi:hypothetical protein APHAL10511_003829, partial [Amanita phalloides]